MSSDLKKMDPKQAEILVLTQVRNNIGKTGDMHKLNFEVHVQVSRLPDVVGKSLKSLVKQKLRKDELKKLTKEYSVPVYQLRSKHELDVQDSLTGVPLEQAPDKRTELMRANYIYPNGGYTKIEFVHPVTGKTYVGEAQCHILDQFNRQVSHCRAWGKIYRQLLEDSSMGFKVGKSVIDALVRS